jgi:hypothetical protein
LWLSSVVLEELYAGAGDRERRVVERLERDFDRVKRILVPNLSDWTQAGKVLARFCQEKDERRADDYGKDLRNGNIPDCSKTPGRKQTSLATNVPAPGSTGSPR